MRKMFCLVSLYLFFALANAFAEGAIYSFVDEQGVEHFTNIPGDRRYRVLFRDRLTPAASDLTIPHGVFAKLPESRPFHQTISEASRLSGVDAALLHAVISVESGYQKNAVSPKGATGLMQLMPATAKRYGLVNPHDPVENIRGGAYYLRDLLRMFDNDIELALAGYNAGENAVISHGRRIPPYGETRRYVPLVLAHYKRLSAGREH